MGDAKNYVSITVNNQWDVLARLENYILMGKLVLVSIAVDFIWASTWENLSSGVCKNKGADQPAHMCSLISAFVIRLLESSISKLATGEISYF